MGAHWSGGEHRRSRSRGRRSWISRLVLALFFAGVSVASPGIAGAASAGITGSVDCVIPGSGGAFTAVLGYDNSWGHTRSLRDGPLNQLTPSKYDGAQPTTFDTGVHHGAFSIQVTTGSATWKLVGVAIPITATSAPRCPPPTQLPADGNGTGVVVGLGIAGALGILLVRHLQRRLVADAPAHASSAAVRYTDLEVGNA